MNRGAVKVGISLSNRFSILEIFRGIVGKRGWDYLERRHKLRTKCRIEASLFYGTGLMGAEIRDVSVSGVQVVCRGRVPRGAEVEIRGLKLYHQAEFHTVRCVVRWSRKDPQGCVVGLEFLDSFEEVAQSWLAWELKANNIKGANAFRQSHVVGDRPENLRCWKRNVKKKSSAPPTARILQMPGQKEEMVVLDPDNVRLACLGLNGFGKSAIDRFISREIVAVEDGEVESVVHDRPENAVGVAEIEALIFGFRHINERERDPVFLHELNPAPWNVEDLAAPADPQAT